MALICLAGTLRKCVTDRISRDLIRLGIRRRTLPLSQDLNSQSSPNTTRQGRVPAHGSRMEPCGLSQVLQPLRCQE